ncbi:ubiquinol-cytochrome c reductase iron-sulfur subunit [Acidicapsa dinghuensis]|uniref:Ubiquinol-cytochrome c reductase iron-sulfur subunit n=1 Tax=Acidicapsa dinghuensis TaxID=2218256 RepID=A0ABW1ELA1_9BACT|nr:Rieske 2Fe-2S domain-containing protein [Acidicapsa dinghuensis]
MSEHLEHPEAMDSAPVKTPEQKAAEHSRRTFLFKLSVALNAAVGAVLAVPVVGYLLGPTMKKSSDVGGWVSLGTLDGFPVGETRLAEFVSPTARIGDGETAKTACWVRRIAQQQFQVFAINCAHLNCPVRWFPESHLFMCPCHGGAYYQDGSRASGPPERGLFEYRYQVSGNTLSIHAGDMPTLSTQASCGGADREKKLVQIQSADTRSEA